VDITVSARHIDISTALRAAAEEKIGRLGRFLDGMLRAEVHFSEEQNPRIADREVCEVTMEGKGHHLRCKAAAGDQFAAIDRAVAKLEQQLHKAKTKKVLQTHRGPRRGAAAATADGTATEDDGAAEYGALAADDEHDPGIMGAAG
jgi:putative sigma-54 modulation protein